MIDLTKKIEDISINSKEDYSKSLELINDIVFDSNSDEGKKIRKLIEEINRYHFNLENEKQLEDNRLKIIKSNIKKSVI